MHSTSHSHNAARLLLVAAVTLGFSGPVAAASAKPAAPTAKAKVVAKVKAAAKARAAAVPKYRKRACPNPVGHTTTVCRIGIHGIPDLSRLRWGQLFDREVTISDVVTALVPNSAAAGSPDWPLIDSLGQPMGRLRFNPATMRFRLVALDGSEYSVIAVNSRGHGCAADDQQSKTFPLVQIIAPKVPSHGTQAFIDGRALEPMSMASARFVNQRGGGTGCGPAGPERGKLRALKDPNVGATAHARLSNGVINTVTEYDAKAPFGGTVYFMSNTTQVPVGGIARGMIRVGTPVAKVDRFRACDPNSDGTLTWRYWAIHTGNPARPRIYGWIPAVCRLPGHA
jgi:hypothetical protein